MHLCVTTMILQFALFDCIDYKQVCFYVKITVSPLTACTRRKYRNRPRRLCLGRLIIIREKTYGVNLLIRVAQLPMAVRTPGP